MDFDWEFNMEVEKVPDKIEETALFWYKLIQPFLDGKTSASSRKKTMREMVQCLYQIPYSTKTMVSEANILMKLYLYRKYGFQGLKPKTRSDKGDIKAIPPDVLEKALEFKKELPSRSSRKIIQMLKMRSDIPYGGTVSIATLCRHFKKMGFTKKLLEDPEKGVFGTFRYEKINQLWQGDAMHGPILPHPADGRKKIKTKLFALKDDCSSLVTGAKFYPDETLPSLEDCLKNAILQRGCPSAVYVDNAKVFHAEQFALILAELGIRIYHSTIYRPQGRAKIESFFAFVQSDFVPEAKMEIKAGNIQALSDLNKYFQAWLEINYHHKIHTVLKRTPASIWNEQQDIIQYADPLKLDQIFLWRKTRFVSKHKTISIEDNLYEVAPEMVGQNINVRFNPYELDKVYVFDNDGNFLMKTIPTDIKTIQSRKVPKKIPDKKEKALSVSYLSMILDQYKKMAKEKMSKISFQALQEAEQKVEQRKNEFVEKFQKAFNAKADLTTRNTLLGMYEQFGKKLSQVLPGVQKQAEDDKIIFDGKNQIILSKILNLLRKAVLNQDGKGT
ncbi:MAG: DDE-type integrase/transposase/recombinase [Candidatus Omnitrophica bacterium]|nr:DDE-type integrase/transposase/recombinase [Candidatus Omnitrophota bacterium]